MKELTVAEHLDLAIIPSYLEAIFEEAEGDADVIKAGLWEAVRSVGVEKVAKGIPHYTHHGELQEELTDATIGLSMTTVMLVLGYFNMSLTALPND